MNHSAPVSLVTAIFLILTFSTGANAETAEDDAGKKQFNKCAACHSLEAEIHLQGPSLSGLFGRKAGSANGFVFSPALEQAGFIWTDETLSAFLKNPMEYIPGNSMPFGGLKKPDQREDLIEYLKQF
jgi:cytochrome c